MISQPGLEINLTAWWSVAPFRLRAFAAALDFALALGLACQERASIVDGFSSNIWANFDHHPKYGCKMLKMRMLEPANKVSQCKSTPDSRIFNTTNSSHMPSQHLTFPLQNSALDTRREICISHCLPMFILQFRSFTTIWSTWSPAVYDQTRQRQRVWSKKLRLERQEFKQPFHDVQNSNCNALELQGPMLRAHFVLHHGLCADRGAIRVRHSPWAEDRLCHKK